MGVRDWCCANRASDLDPWAGWKKAIGIRLDTVFGQASRLRAATVPVVTPSHLACARLKSTNSTEVEMAVTAAARGTAVFRQFQPPT